MLTKAQKEEFLASIFIDFSVIEMKVLQGHFHLLLAYGFSSHVNYFATLHFNSFAVIVWQNHHLISLCEDIHRLLS